MRHATLLLLLTLVFALLPWPAQPASAAPRIGAPTVLTPQVARYGRFEIHFEVTTVARYPDLPYDPTPPPGLLPGLGVSVDALLSPDGWQTQIVQPAFRYQPFRYSLRDGKDHRVPDGPPRWAVRFTPQQPGEWQYRLRVRDAGGTTIYPEGSALGFRVAGEAEGARRKGFLHVSARDPRYFEFQDGSPFVGVGFNEGFGSVAEAAARLPRLAEYKINFLRIWMSGAGINGSHWTPWASHHLSYDGYLPPVSLDTQTTYDGSDVALRLDASNPCLFSDAVPVQPNTSYRVEARVRTRDLSGPAGAGFVIKTGGWLDRACAETATGRPITSPLAGTTDWLVVSGVVQTRADQHWLDNLYLTRQGATGGTVLIDEVRFYRADDPERINLLQDPYANSHLHFDPLAADGWDRIIDLAEQHGVYLKIVVDEKNEWIRNRIGADGKLDGEPSNDKFYAEPQTKSRWLQEAWWRYLTARWGYSTAVHSWEYVNEGDPYSGPHHEAADAFARYADQHDPSRHLVTTSFWHSFPGAEFWSNPRYSALDYADIHAYISTGWGRDASFLPAELAETRPAFVRSGTGAARLPASFAGHQAITPRGLVLRGPGEWILRYWMRADKLAADCPFGSSGGMQRVRWMLDGGTFGGGKEGVVPFNAEGKDFICTSPAGSYSWREFRSDRDRDGVLLPEAQRIVISDTLPHELTLFVENSNGQNGEAWIDDLVLVAPNGEEVPVLGGFERTAMDDDTAWFVRAYADLLGGQSPVGARKPLVRGETGVDAPEQQDWNRALNQDEEGIWLHNMVWAQIGPGGMYDLLWWADATIRQNPDTGRATDIYTGFLTFRTFMDDIPLSNGKYRDAKAQASDPRLRAWGQRDDHNGRAHLWLQNVDHTWTRVVAGEQILPVSGTVVLNDLPGGTYEAAWWDTYGRGQVIAERHTVDATGVLRLALPAPLSRDIALKLRRVGLEQAQRGTYLPLVTAPKRAE
jgi:hypothetical protein